jgi:hypothetical protein
MIDPLVTTRCNVDERTVQRVDVDDPARGNRQSQDHSSL